MAWTGARPCCKHKALSCQNRLWRGGNSNKTRSNRSSWSVRGVNQQTQSSVTTTTTTRLSLGTSAELARGTGPKAERFETFLLVAMAGKTSAPGNQTLVPPPQKPPQTVLVLFTPRLGWSTIPTWHLIEPMVFRGLTVTWQLMESKGSTHIWEFFFLNRV